MIAFSVISLIIFILILINLINWVIILGLQDDIPSGVAIIITIVGLIICLIILKYIIIWGQQLSIFQQ